MDTQLAEVDRGLLVPVAGSTYTRGDYTRTRSTGEPFATQTTDRDKALVTAPMLMPYNRTGQPKPVDHPTQTLAATEGQALVGAGRIRIEDCTFRMLEPHEIGAAMAFPESYAVKGNKRERVRQYGNAVTPPVMKWLIEQTTECLR